ncbi:MAG: hypothetical protein FWD34_01915 [Oscillospiraceae bacterium]|nr:hypothetical protein [Oscillospiraceae bacterium]
MKNIKAEKLNTAIGGINDKHIEAVGALRNNAPIKEKRTNFRVVQFTGIAAAAILLAVGTFAMFTYLAPDDIIDPPKPPATHDIEPVWSWIVEPTLDYSYISYDLAKDYYFVPVDFDYTGYEIDYAVLSETTGEHGRVFTVSGDDYEDLTPGQIFVNWLYDEELELFGRRTYEMGEYSIEMYPISEFAERFPEAVGRIKHVYLIDSLTFDDENAFQSGSGTPPGTVFFNGEQIIDDAPYRGSGSVGRELFDIITVYDVDGNDGSGGVGIINKYGDIIVPVVFWEINLINETTAFARLPDGKWGIIGFGDYVHEEAPLIGYTWVVEPTLEYDVISYCSYCDVFYGFDYSENNMSEYDMPLNYILNEMGQLTGEFHEPHPKYSLPGGIVWVYDPDLDLFGWFQHISPDVGAIYELYPMSEFAERFPKEVDRIRTVRRYDTTVSTRGSEFLPGEGYSGDAVMYGNEFITEFEYIMQTNLGKEQMSIVAINRDGDGSEEGKYGIVNKDGVIIVPFESWVIVTISETTAFANKDGKWGIIGFNGYKPPEAVIVQPNYPIQPFTDEVILSEFVQRICDARAMMPYFNDINDVQLITILHQYFNAYGWDWNDTSVFSDGEDQHHYIDDDYFGVKLGVSPARLNSFMQEYYNPDFSIESYDYKAITMWDSERGLIVGSIYGGGLHMWRSSHITEIREENGIYSVYALKVEWGDGYYITDMEYILCTFTRNDNGNFNIMSKQLVPESEYPERLSEFIGFMNAVLNDIEIAYECAFTFDIFDELDEIRQCFYCDESPRRICDGCIVNGATGIIFYKALEMYMSGMD